jgi:alanyl-tRNA synthetase
MFQAGCLAGHTRFRCWVDIQLCWFFRRHSVYFSYPQRTRFDFSHPHKLTDEEKREVERLINDWIARDLRVERTVMSQEEARRLGTIGAFGEKYSEIVSIYTVSDPETNEIVNREFCGGPHLTHTGAIGNFTIVKEETSSTGVRRIKAVVQQRPRRDLAVSSYPS